MAMTLYQKAYMETLSGATKTTYIRTKYDTYSETASTATSAYAAKKADEKLHVHAYTRKLTKLNGSRA